ncbi:hypothetical protein L6452_27421 [Arctium lappa]|uniref:Uncharacterized protein n=1 Tax=Arctium lappa TaxID=4217 RepID=A0ACB8ZW98_ARCLA|nr:hypothetical protein L6452_27421 [Arctium lappa]
MDNFCVNHEDVNGSATLDSQVSGQFALDSQFFGSEDDEVADSQVSVTVGVDVDASFFTSEAVNGDVVLVFDSMKCNSSHIVVGNSQSEDCFRAEDCFVHDVEVNDEG